jgi:transposase InsO family protein
MEQTVLQVKKEHMVWGGRKIKTLLERKGLEDLPSASTITRIFQRNGLIDPQESIKHKPCVRFERREPNGLWQMDFKGHFALENGRCHPLTVLDDHSRFNIILKACPNEQTAVVQEALIQAFRCYGLPNAMLMDNGSPWGKDDDSPYTALTVWLLRLGIEVFHGRSFHPQTQGKVERFHRTLKAEVLQGQIFRDLAHVQEVLDPWRHTYNHKRPNEAIAMQVPADRYFPSNRTFPEQLPPIEYGPGDIVRTVHIGGLLSFHGSEYRVGKAFRGYPLAVRPTSTDGVWDVFFLTHLIAQIDERIPIPELAIDHVPHEE